MRLLAWIGFLCVFSSSWAQGQPETKGNDKPPAQDQKQPEKPPADTKLEMGRPDVTIVIREHATSADLVQVTMARPDYPPDLLRQQLETMGRELGSAPRGLNIAVTSLAPNRKELQFVKATFAVNGILDREGQRLNIAPILKGFAGAPAPFTVENLLIIFDGERPGERTVKNHTSDSVDAKAYFVPSPTEIEYHVKLRSQDPAKIDFPAQAPEPTSTKNPSEERSSSPLLFYVALGVGALAVGALVYLALLRGGGTARR